MDQGTFTILLVVGILVFFWTVSSKLNKKSADEMKLELLSRINIDVKKLARKRARLLYDDGYGNLVWDKWEREKEYYIFSVLLGEVDKRSRSQYSNQTKNMINAIFDDIDTIINNYNSNVMENNNNENMNVATVLEQNHATWDEFEDTCYDIAFRAGFVVEKVAGSGDFGADVIAEYLGYKVAIQCKYYSQPVGNKAVQEVFSAKDYYDCFYAIVVSNNEFTHQATVTAEKHGVLLTHVDDLFQLLCLVVSNIDNNAYAGGE